MSVDRRAVLAAVADQLWPGHHGTIEIHMHGQATQVKEVVSYQVERKATDPDLLEAFLVAVNERRMKGGASK